MQLIYLVTLSCNTLDRKQFAQWDFISLKTFLIGFRAVLLADNTTKTKGKWVSFFLNVHLQCGYPALPV